MGQLFKWSAVFGAVALVAACGGGGGGGGGTSGVGNSSSTTVSGTASKGLLKFAKVTAFCGIKSANNPIGTTNTLADGTYSLTLTQSCAQPVQIVVSAVAGTTKMVDEIKGEIDAPATLSLRAFVPAAGSSVSLPVTPFTDMAAALVENSVNSNNALSAAMVSNANSAIISTVLGGNAGLFTAQPLRPGAYNDGTTSADQKKLIVLLSAISQAAASIGSADGPGADVQTILTQLAAQATQTIPSVTATTYTVSSDADVRALSGTNATPLATISSGLKDLATSDDAFNLGDAASAIQASVTDVQTAVVSTSNTQIAGAIVAGGSVSTPTSAVQSAIAAATQLFTAIRTNLLSLVNPQQTGFLQAKATALTNDINSLALEGTYQFTDILLAAHRATGFLAQANLALAAGGGSANAPSGAEAKTNAFGKFYQKVWSEGGSTTQCNAYYAVNPNNPSGILTSESSVPFDRTSPLNSNNGNPVAICNKFIYADNNVRMMQFIVKSPASKPTNGTNTFTYVNRVRLWADANCTSAADATCGYEDSQEVTGELTATLGSSQNVTALATVNQPIIPFRGESATTFSVNYTASDVNHVNTLTFSGGLTDGPLKFGFGNGSQLVVTDTSAGARTSGTVVANLLGQIQTGAFQLDGTFALNAAKSGSNADATGTMGFNGKISTLNAGVATTFLEGSLNGNANTNVASFSGKVTQGSSVNSIALTSDLSIDGQQTVSLTILTPGYTFTATGTNFDDQSTASTMTVTASDGTKLAIRRINGASTVTVRNSADTEIGSVVGNQVNFKDGSFILLN